MEGGETRLGRSVCMVAKAKILNDPHLWERRLEKAPRRRSGGVGVGTMMVLVLLLAVPAYALSRFSGAIDWRLLVGVSFGASLFTFFAYRIDKKRAEADEWRIPESSLHLAELVGGWPGGFLAQRVFRHKISKVSYQVEFWMIVVLYQVVAVDSLCGWRMVKAGWDFFKSRH
jgi:uncharacterized membrane protein YsdA (DUF1294 family)